MSFVHKIVLSGVRSYRACRAGIFLGCKKLSWNENSPIMEHGVMIDEATRRVRYNYSPQEFTSGAYRFKHHLAGTSKDVKSCDVAGTKVGVDSNGKRKSVWEIARKDRFIRGVNTLTQTKINGA
ncbi:hypothetical protein TSUD_280280 [Trifolium subterraneum]|uniref:Uncharacterized protein n=1 Tax=Trifolium subterraneum TaxID=3900 RepID=A0A2Z6N8V5_TRISU|nr:hypothetical protein TSUD_280280 [Trifolium subterraneum]